MKENKAATAPAPAAGKKKASPAGGAGGGSPQKRARDADADGDAPSQRDPFIDLPDAILGTIISLLPTKDGARTQALTRLWRPLWRAAPLNLDVNGLLLDTERIRHPTVELDILSTVSEILSGHRGPARRFVFNDIWPHRRHGSFEDPSRVEGWLCAPALDGLQELDISFRPWGQPQELERCRYPLPPSVLRLAATLLSARIGMFDFPKELPPSLGFPVLKQLDLWSMSISEDVFRRVLSSCPVLEDLTLDQIHGVGCLSISSPTLRVIAIISVLFMVVMERKRELVIQDTPVLQRLLLGSQALDGDIVRVVRAPKLEMLGLLSPSISRIEIENLVLQGLIPNSSKYPIHTVKVLALDFYEPYLNRVLLILRCFPCLEKLYVIRAHINTEMTDVHEYDPLDPIKCLESHLTILVLKNYEGGEEDVAFAKFFVLNAKVVKEIKFAVDETVCIDKKWMTDQHRLLQVENKASRDAQLKFKGGSASWDNCLDTHDLSIADPFKCCFVDGVDDLSIE